MLVEENTAKTSRSPGGSSSCSIWPPRAFGWSTRRTLSALLVAIGPSSSTPAAWKTPFSEPKRARQSATTAAIASWSATSALKVRMRAPSLSSASRRRINRTSGEQSPLAASPGQLAFEGRARRLTRAMRAFFFAR